MHGWAYRIGLVAVAGLAGAGGLVPAAAQTAWADSTARAGSAGAAPAAAAPKWTKISTGTGMGIASAGLFRTADSRLHVAWARDDHGTFSLHYSTVGGKAKLLATGTILQKWSGVSVYPRLVAGPGGGIRLVFTGGDGTNGSPFNLGAMYSATASAAGTKWTLVHGSLSQSKLVPLTGTSATTERNGTPVAAWAGGSGVAFHVGVDPSTPASGSDGTVAVAEGSGEVNGTTLARASDGSVSAAWFTGSFKSDQGYWVARILPTKAAKAKAPGSGGASVASNQPLQSVAFAARAGGGDYLAYCVPAKTVPCAHIALWRVSARKAITVPGSGSQHATRVAIAAAPGGHLWILWYDTSQNKIHVIRTNAAATKFGAAATIAAPPRTAELDGLQAEGSKGPLDVVALVLQTTSGSTPAYWDIQLLPKLRLKGSPSAVSHTRRTTISFTVSDVGQPVSGARVTFLHKTVKTNGRGVARITVPRGTRAGKYKARAAKASYTAATFTVKVR
jgi:hypothetical protein